MLVPAFDTGEAGDAFLAGASGAAVEALFVRTGFQAFAVATATLLVDEDNAVITAYQQLAPDGGPGLLLILAPRRYYYSTTYALTNYAAQGKDGLWPNYTIDSDATAVLCVFSMQALMIYASGSKKRAARRPAWAGCCDR